MSDKKYGYNPGDKIYDITSNRVVKRYSFIDYLPRNNNYVMVLDELSKIPVRLYVPDYEKLLEKGIKNRKLLLEEQVRISYADYQYHLERLEEFNKENKNG